MYTVLARRTLLCVGFFLLPFKVEKTIYETVKRSKHGPFEQGVVLTPSVSWGLRAVLFSVRRFCSVLTQSYLFENCWREVRSSKLLFGRIWRPRVNKERNRLDCPQLYRLLSRSFHKHTISHFHVKNSFSTFKNHLHEGMMMLHSMCLVLSTFQKQFYRCSSG